MNPNLEMIMITRENNELMRKLKDDIIEEWHAATEIKMLGCDRDVFINAMKHEIPRLKNEEAEISEETFLRVYYDNTPFWCRVEKQE